MKYKPNLNLLDDFSDIKQHVNYPMVAVFEFAGKKLIYVGTKHNSQANRVPKSFDAINYCFDNFDIDFIVTECAHTHKLKDYESLLYQPGMNELIYAPLIGKQNNISYKFIDADEKDWFADVVSIDEKYIKIMQVFFVLNDAYKYKQIFTENFSIQRSIDNVVYKFWKDGYPAPMNQAKFQAFFRKNFGFNVTDDNLSDLLKDNPEWNAPDKNGNIINKAWSYINMYSRDKKMVCEIFNAMNKYKCVMATIGAGHFDNQRRVLESSFGKPLLLYKFPKSSRRDTIK